MLTDSAGLHKFPVSVDVFVEVEDLVSEGGVKHAPSALSVRRPPSVRRNAALPHHGA